MCACVVCVYVCVLFFLGCILGESLYVTGWVGLCPGQECVCVCVCVGCVCVCAVFPGCMLGESLYITG